MNSLKRSTITLFILAGMLSSCYTVRVNLGPTCQAAVNDEDSFWRDIQFTDTIVRMKPAQTPNMVIPCAGQCVCRMEYKVGFGNVVVSAITLGFVRRVKIRYACCQQQNN
jgi:hypothetical protein